RQIWALYREWRLGRIGLSQLLGRMAAVPVRDWVAAAALVGDAEIRRAALERIQLRRSEPARYFWRDLRPAPGVEDIVAFAAWVAARPPVERT
ncbi:MAG: hypothetical protein ACRDF0_02020, partial [Candidatus Limnocylindria bacterium]